MLEFFNKRQQDEIIRQIAKEMDLDPDIVRRNEKIIEDYLKEHQTINEEIIKL